MNSDKEKLIQKLRDTLSIYRDVMVGTDDPELVAIGKSLDAYILVTYNPSHLRDLTLMLTEFLNSKLGGEN